MFDKLITPYKGFSKEVWFLALITFVNRAGAMVIPFLSLYLTKDLGFSLSQVGWIMSCFGFGSLLGVYLGGKLSDQIGYYKVMYSSLLLSGLVFLILQYFQSLLAVCIGFFALSLVADVFRPALWVALSTHSREENRTRSVTLIRLAINLGFSLGPALGGLIIVAIGYKGLFWADGLTCIIAGVLLLKLLKPKKTAPIEELPQRINQSPYRDKPYLLFWLGMFLIGFCFMQYFATVPLYFHEEYNLSEKQIGSILALNGLIIFLIEMPIIHHLVVKKTDMMNMTILGTLLLLLSFLVMNFPFWIGIPVLGIVLMTLGEILNFPFSNTYALQRAQRGNKGAYMALYSMSFSVAHILGPNIGMQLTEKFEFRTTWMVMAGLLFIAMVLFLIVKRLDQLALKN
ncbi:MFS transporter [Namhaeicola litoreus]|uniref:MFS transporter n=1 Tax=Namhaeicola litoreus TaxID=1052145 RepID=A0ABW3Y5S3_9FLAO